MAKKKKKASKKKASKASSARRYPFKTTTKREAYLQGPNVFLPAGHSIVVVYEERGLGFVSAKHGGETLRGVMKKSSYHQP